MVLKENKKIKYVGEFNKIWVHDKEEDRTYMTKAIGIDFMERGKKYSSVYDVINGKDISDSKRYAIFLKDNNILGFGGTRVRPLYLEEGWGKDDEN